ITNPVITSTHNDESLDADVNCEAVLPDYTSNVMATDNCDASLEVTQSPLAGATILGATNQVTLTVTDDAGNFIDVSFNVEVIDNTDPTITCLDDQTVYYRMGQTYYTVSGTEFDPVSTSDNCVIASITNDFNDLETLDAAQFPIATTTVTWTVTDEAGNSATCSFDVTVTETVGISDIAKIGISIYPNPTSGILKLEFKQNNIKNIRVSDLSGSIKIEKTDVQQNEIIDLSPLQDGIYIIRIQTDNDIFVTKIVKEY
ncbi:MAG: T9SS type A sorting domain-containing protein, partial [Bacteroidota bacterium]